MRILLSCRQAPERSGDAALDGTLLLPGIAAHLNGLTTKGVVMKKIGLTYWSCSGNTELLAKRFAEALSAVGAATVSGEVTEVDAADILACDALVLGSPARGAEQLSEEMQAFMDNIDDEMQDKPVVLFGSYGWGGGEYMNIWREQVAEQGGRLAADPVICLNEPDAAALASADAAVAALLEQL